MIVHGGYLAIVPYDLSIRTERPGSFLMSCSERSPCPTHVPADFLQTCRPFGKQPDPGRKPLPKKTASAVFLHSSVFFFDDLFAVVVTASFADAMVENELAAMRALRQLRHIDLPGAGTSSVSARLGYLSLRYCHFCPSLQQDYPCTNPYYIRTRVSPPRLHSIIHNSRSFFK